MRRKIFTPLRPSTTPIKIIAFDTEDNSQGAPANFICACFYSDDEQRTFFVREQAREYMLAKRNEPVVFFAHNLAYDLANLDYPEGDIKQMVTHGKLIGGLYKYGTRISRFMDTGNFFVGASIHSLGKLFGDDKLDFDISKIKNKDPPDIPFDIKTECALYCMKDAKICYMTAKKIVDLCNKHQTRFKSFTSGSLSLRLFRTCYMDNEWECRSQYINDCERSAYYGGRTEVFNYNKHGSVYYEDINSSYPTAMFHKQFPVPWSYTLLKHQDWNTIKNTMGISLVTIYVPEMRIPPLPYKRTDTGKLIFPTGKWTSSYVHEELVMAERYGCKVLQMHETVLYGETFNPFKDYVSDMHKLKSSAPNPGIERDFYKMMMNSLSGKLGEKRDTCIRLHVDDVKCCLCPTTEYDNDSKCTKCGGYNICGKTLEPDENGWVNIIGSRQPDPPHSFPCLIAYITAYGRIKLYEDRLQHQDAIYCDTDSCISETDHPDNRGNELGQWDTKIVRDFMAYAPKFYTMYDNEKFKLKLKGVPKRHTFFYICPNNHKHISPPCIGKCPINHSESTILCATCQSPIAENQKFYAYEKPMRLSEAIHRKKAPNKWESLEKIVSIFDNKRLKLPNGDSTPIYIQDNDVSSFSEQIEKYTR